jgi:hypothetical protein
MTSSAKEIHQAESINGPLNYQNMSLILKKRSTIKLWVIADFIVEWTESNSYTEGPVLEFPWLIYCDRAWGNTGAGALVILIAPSRIKLRYAARLQFTKEIDKCTNNFTKCKALLLGLRKL